MEQTTLTRRTLLRMGALSTTALAASVMRSAAAAGDVAADAGIFPVGQRNGQSGY